MQDPSELGFDIIMNSKKKNFSDSSSVASSKKTPSIKSEIIDIKQHMHKFSGASDDKSELSYDITEEDEPIYHRPQQKKAHQQRPESEVESSDYETDDGKSTVFKRKMSEEDIINEKQELLYQFDRLEKKGIRIPRKYNMTSDLEDMRAEFERLKRDREVDSSVKFQRRMVMAFASGVEYLNDKFDPFDIKLSGWSEKVHDDIDDYDEIFEELYSKYKSKAKMAPELKLVFMMGSSAFMFHLTNSMFKTSLPGLDQVLKQNPELMKQFAAATASTMAQEQKKNNSPFGGLASMFSGMFGGGGGNTNSNINDVVVKPQHHSPPSDASSESDFNPPPRPIMHNKMRGPSNIDDIMNEIQISNNDRIEMMSSVTESELFDIPDDASINGMLSKKKPSKKTNKKSLNI